MKTPILGSAYVARSVNAADSRMVNLFPEVIPEGGKEPAFLNRAPGLRLLATIGTGPVRGMLAYKGFLYVVSGTKFYKVNSAYSATEIGTVAGTGSVTITSGINGTEPLTATEHIFVAASGLGYLYDVAGATIAEVPVTEGGFLGSVSVAWLDNHFIVITPDGFIQFSNGLTFDAADIEDIQPDIAVAVLVDHREIWVFGDNSTSVWYNDGTADFLSRIQGATNEIGCASPYSVAKLDNGIFWLGKDARGQGIVYRANGYAGQRISTHAVEWQIQQYSDLSDAIGYTYQQDGHSFYVLIFPGADTTWVYDVATGAWHERAGFSAEFASFTRHRSNCQAVFNGLIVVGDYENGCVYALDLDIYDDNGAAQRWLRSWRAVPTGQNHLKRSAHHSIQLDCESGVGLVSGQGSDPQVMLRWSDDGGHTWSNEHWASMGGIGQYGTRVIWRRLGMTTKLRDRVYEVSGTDPVKLAILGAELIASGTNA